MTPRYQSGFGSEFATEALAGALPVGRNSPQRPPYGLYAEQMSGPRSPPRGMQTAAPGCTGSGRRWCTAASQPIAQPAARAARRSTTAAASPNQLRWDPFPVPDGADRFHRRHRDDRRQWRRRQRRRASPSIVYAANRSMRGRYFYNADGEMLVVPQQGGAADCAPSSACSTSSRARSPSCRAACASAVELAPSGPGARLRLRELRRLAPAARARSDRRERPCQSARFPGAGRRVRASRRATSSWWRNSRARLWRAPIDHSPLDVVAWHGNYAPYKYDLARFNAINTVSFDHPDPSIFTVLTSPSDTAGTANVDFVIFPPRWMVAEDTFRPPWFHRNVMSEYMGLIRGVYDAKAEGFLPGGGSLHNACRGTVPTPRRSSARRMRTRAAEARVIPWPSCSRAATCSTRRRMRSPPRSSSATTRRAGRR